MRAMVRTGVLVAWLVAFGSGQAGWAEAPDPWARFVQAWERGDRTARTTALEALQGELRRQGGVLKGRDSMRFVFVASGQEAAKGVSLGADFTGWAGRVPLQRVGQGPVHAYLLQAVPSDARVEYKYYVGGRECLDPLNPRRVDNGMGGENSVACMPGYRGVLPEGRVPLRAGSLVQVDFRSRIMANRRRVSVYLPPSYRSDARRTYPTVYIHDGSPYLKLAQAAAVVDALVRKGRIDEVILVFVDPVDRWKEYSRNADFTRMFVEELLPYVEGRFRTRREPAARCVLGASLGGLCAVHLAFAHPEVFGLVASQSGAFAYGERPLGLEISVAPRKPLQVYLDVGLYDLRDDKRSLLDQNREMKVVLESRGYPLHYHEFAGGHNYSCWADQWPRLLEYFFKKTP